MGDTLTLDSDPIEEFTEDEDGQGCSKAMESEIESAEYAGSTTTAGPTGGRRR